MFQALSHAIKGIDGTVELNRLVGFLGGFAYILCANIFTGYEVFWLGKDFDITAYCLAFGGGLAAIAGGTAGAVALKDRNVASASITAATGTIPAPPPEGPRTPVGTDVRPPGGDEPEVDLAP